MRDAAKPSDWCLFVSRDGLLNQPGASGCVRSPSEFVWLPDALAALVALSHWAPFVVVVTNQAGVGKGLIEPGALDEIHAALRQQLTSAGGRLDDILVCPHPKRDRCRCRKPRASLPLAWLAEHPEIDPEKCVVVGDTWRDVAMGRVLTSGSGSCVWVGPKDAPSPVPEPDARYQTLSEFAHAVGAFESVRETA